MKLEKLLQTQVATRKALDLGAVWLSLLGLGAFFLGIKPF